MTEPGIAAQLIVYGDRPENDLGRVLDEVAKIGYDAAEIGASFFDHDVADVKRAFDNAGIECSGVHSGYGLVSDTEWRPKALEFFDAVGAEFTLCSGVADAEGLKQYEDAADTFNEWGRQCAEAGVTFCYHNHGWEFQQHDGTKGIHRLCEMTDPAVVKLNVDVYWVTVGGEHPAEFIERYNHRVGYYHFKDGPYTPDGTVADRPYEFTELGRGTVDLQAALNAALKYDPAWVVYEQDRTELEPKQAAQISFEHLKSIGL